MELDGYASLDAAFARDPAELVQIVKDSGLRGRGGAGFPTGMKWGFLAQGHRKPTYLVVNADESEPGTFKDMELVERDPHALVEGTIVSAYAIGCNQAFIYIRGECGFAGRRLAAAVGQAYERGLLGRDIKGSGFDLDVVLHRGAGAYICGEETALLSSLEGQRGQPKLRPPFPAVEGLYRAPTTVNNVETIAAVPWIFRKGVDWFRSMGTEKSPGPKLFSVCGEVERPGNYEYPLGTPARELIMGGRPQGVLEVAGPLDVAGDAEQLRAGRLLGAHRSEPLHAPAEDPRDGGDRLDVVDRGRRPVQALHGRERRPQLGLAALALQRRQQRGLLAADVGAGAPVQDHV